MNFKLPPFRKEFVEASDIPRYYGYAWNTEKYFGYVCYIIPFNLVMIVLKQLWWFFRHPQNYLKRFTKVELCSPHLKFWAKRGNFDGLNSKGHNQ